MVAISRGRSKGFEKLIIRVNKLEGVQGRVGFFENSKYEDGTPVAYIAALNEFGHFPTPPRPFMREAINENQAKWAKTAEYGAKQVLAGDASSQDAMELLTTVAEGDIRKSVQTLIAPKLSPLTVGLRAYKKKFPNAKITAATLGIVSRMLREGALDISGVSDKPLIDTGVLINAIKSKVETL